MRNWLMLSLKWTLMLAAAGYMAFVALLYLTQRSMLYHPRSMHVTPAAAGLPATEEVLETSDGEKVILWHVPPRDDRPVVIYFHGNAEIIPMRAARHRATIADGIGLVALSYRGYMNSTGSPTEQGLMRDAEAAYAFAAARYPSQRIAVWGVSLGTGVVVALAATHPVGKLILEAPFTSTADVAASLFPFVPVRWLMLDQFRSDERIAEVTAPLLVLHGERDMVVPIRFGERLYALAHEPKRSCATPPADMTISTRLVRARRRGASSRRRRDSEQRIAEFRTLLAIPLPFATRAQISFPTVPVLHAKWRVYGRKRQFSDQR